MSVNFAEEYARDIDEGFHSASLTDIAVNEDFEFEGVNKVHIFSVDTVPLNDYDMTAAANRYGTPVELGNDVQTLELTQDKSFAFTIDRRNNDDTQMTLNAAKMLGKQIKEVIVPTVDTYRLGVLVREVKPEHVKEETITKTNAYEAFLDASVVLFDAHVPSEGRVAFVSPAYYKFIKLDKNFTSSGDRAHEMAVNGVVGTVDNTNIVVAPTSYLPEGVNFLVTHPSAMTSPKKIADYTQHENPQGLNGWLCEGRLYYDAFVLNNKRPAIYVSKRP